MRSLISCTVLAFLFLLNAQTTYAQKKQKRKHTKQKYRELIAKSYTRGPAPFEELKEPAFEEEEAASELASAFVWIAGAEACWQEKVEKAILDEECYLESAEPVRPAPCPTPLIPVNGCQMVPTDYFTASDYFHTWSTTDVNPYAFDMREFKDTLHLVLHCDQEGQHWSYPLRNTVVNSKFGHRRYRFHHGIDLDLNIGDPIYAVFDGVVRIARYNRGGYGNYVVVRHKNGLETLYGHLSEYRVEVGQEVRAGEMIGLGGNTGRSTGPHLHFEVRYKGHAFDPSHLFDFENEALLSSEFYLTPAHFNKIVAMRQSVVHRIRKGDTLSGISKKYGTTVAKLTQLNGLSRNATLAVGKPLRVR